MPAQIPQCDLSPTEGRPKYATITNLPPTAGPGYFLYPTTFPYHKWLVQSLHLHSTAHATPALKHSQYFFWHSVFLQLQYGLPLQFLDLFFLLHRIYSTASLFLLVLLQLQQLHSSPQASPLRKHSQYSFMHPVFLHTHPIFLRTPEALKDSSVFI